jgi:hypothetical protein
LQDKLSSISWQACPTFPSLLQEYRPQHVASLISCMPHLSKKARQQALALVGESEKGPSVAVAILGSGVK